MATGVQSTEVDEVRMTIEQCFMGLADRTRLRILNLLLHGELCGCDVQYVLDVSQSNVSRHLNYLRRAGLVLDRRDGYRVFYRLAEREEQSFPLLFDYLRSVFSRDKTFSADLKELKTAIRKGACTISEARKPQRPGRSISARERRAAV
jgi:ArsR family transcriptional regulator, arsenate/arsenite/antimonite-responsive transcriptional repressor